MGHFAARSHPPANQKAQLTTPTMHIARSLIRQCNENRTPEGSGIDVACLWLKLFDPSTPLTVNVLYHTSDASASSDHGSQKLANSRDLDARTA